MSILRLLTLCSLVFVSVLALTQTIARTIPPSSSITILPTWSPSVCRPSRHVSPPSRAQVRRLSRLFSPIRRPRNRAAFAALRLKAGLNQDMLNNFDLFLYVSKAKRGPLAQRLYVFRRKAAKTWRWSMTGPHPPGANGRKLSPRGRRAFTATPPGYYQIDPQRMYRSYHSSIGISPCPMPCSSTGSARGGRPALPFMPPAARSLEKLGQPRQRRLRASVARECRDTLQSYPRGLSGTVPRFAYNPENRTTSNDGAFHARPQRAADDGGRLQGSGFHRGLWRQDASPPWKMIVKSAVIRRGP